MKTERKQSPPKMLPQWKRPCLTAKEVGEIYGVSEDTIARMCVAGKFPGAVKAGMGKHSRWMIPKRSVRGYEDSDWAKATDRGLHALEKAG